MKTFGEILKEKRKKTFDEKGKPYSRKKLSEELGIHERTIELWETGGGYPSILRACDIADFFGCTLDELVGRGVKK